MRCATWQCSFRTHPPTELPGAGSVVPARRVRQVPERAGHAQGRPDGLRRHYKEGVRGEVHHDQLPAVQP
eukprot:5217021-Heterocapsa_arctica.AAC.1